MTTDHVGYAWDCEVCKAAVAHSNAVGGGAAFDAMVAASAAHFAWAATFASAAADVPACMS